MRDIYTLTWAFVFLLLFMLCQHLAVVRSEIWPGLRLRADTGLYQLCNKHLDPFYYCDSWATTPTDCMFSSLVSLPLVSPLSWFPAVRLTHAAWAHKHVHRWQYLWGCVQLGGSEPLPCQCGRGWGQREWDVSGVLWGDIGLGAGRLRGETHNLPNNRRHCAEQARGHHTSMQQDQVQCQKTLDWTQNMKIQNGDKIWNSGQYNNLS